MNLTDALTISAPEVIVALSTLVLILVGSFGGQRSSLLVSSLAILALIGAAVAACFAPWAPGGLCYSRRAFAARSPADDPTSPDRQRDVA